MLGCKLDQRLAPGTRRAEQQDVPRALPQGPLDAQQMPHGVGPQDNRVLAVPRGGEGGGGLEELGLDFGQRREPPGDNKAQQG